MFTFDDEDGRAEETSILLAARRPLRSAA